MTIKIPLVTRSGISSISINGRFVYTVNLSFVTGTCTLNYSATLSDCDVGAEYNVSVTAGVLDKTTGYYTGFSGNWTDWVGTGNSTGCYLGSCGSSNVSINGGGPGTTVVYTGPGAVSLTPNMIANHRYVLVIFVETRTLADVSQHNASIVGAHAAASLDFESLGNGISLTNITES